MSLSSPAKTSLSLVAARMSAGGAFMLPVVENGGTVVAGHNSPSLVVAYLSAGGSLSIDGCNISDGGCSMATPTQHPNVLRLDERREWCSSKSMAAWCFLQTRDRRAGEREQVDEGIPGDKEDKDKVGDELLRAAHLDDLARVRGRDRRNRQLVDRLRTFPFMLTLP
jgi:hypothetical protein